LLLWSLEHGYIKHVLDTSFSLGHNSFQDSDVSNQHLFWILTLASLFCEVIPWGGSDGTTHDLGASLSDAVTHIFC
jgi:hypothetical protein